MADQPKALPRYRCHKVVEALRIASLEYPNGGGLIVAPAEAGYEPFRVPDKFVPTHKAAVPSVGWYWVRYEGGYESFSPAAAFEDGYTLITESEEPAPGEAVYAWMINNPMCGGCGTYLRVSVSRPGHEYRPHLTCSNSACPRHGKLYELSTAHAMILREVAKPAAEPTP